MSDDILTYNEAEQMRDEIIAALAKEGLIVRNNTLSLSGYSATLTLDSARRKTYPKVDNWGVRVRISRAVGPDLKKLVRTTRAAVNLIMKECVTPAKGRVARLEMDLFNDARRTFLTGWWAHRNGYVITRESASLTCFTRGVSEKSGKPWTLSNLSYDEERDMLLTVCEFGGVRGKIDVPNVDVILAAKAVI